MKSRIQSRSRSQRSVRQHNGQSVATFGYGGKPPYTARENGRNERIGGSADGQERARARVHPYPAAPKAQREKVNGEADQKNRIARRKTRIGKRKGTERRNGCGWMLVDVGGEPPHHSATAPDGGRPSEPDRGAGNSAGRREKLFAAARNITLSPEQAARSVCRTRGRPPKIGEKQTKTEASKCKERSRFRR